MFERILQIIPISCFGLIGICNLISHSWKFAGINFVLVLLYIYFIK